MCKLFDIKVNIHKKPDVKEIELSANVKSQTVPIKQPAPNAADIKPQTVPITLSCLQTALPSLRITTVALATNPALGPTITTEQYKENIKVGKQLTKNSRNIKMKKLQIANNLGLRRKAFNDFINDLII
eukprot:706141-Ditylum_brightwellii.AAC.1